MNSGYKNLPPELREQWMKDKAKKAERKMERELERLITIMDPQTPKKGGNKSRKAMIAAAKFDPSIEIPNRIVDMVSVEKQIRRFLANKRRNTMALPAADKEIRKGMHELANAFNLKSKSKGGANGRYTTLTKTKHSGFNISEKKVAGVLKRYKTGAPFGGSQWKGKGKGTQGQIQTREGDVVGHVRITVNFSYLHILLMEFCLGHSLLQKLTEPILDSRCLLPWAGQRVIE
jgi:hypothetical protein